MQLIKMYTWIEEVAKTHDIDIKIDVDKIGLYNCFPDEETTVEVYCYFGDVDVNDFELARGSAPQYENEVAITDKMARRYGLTVGSTLYIEVEDYNEEKTAKVKEKREFYVTGMMQNMNNNGDVIYMSNAFESGVYDHVEGLHAVIFAPEAKKPQLVKKLKEIIGEKAILTEIEYLLIALIFYWILQGLS